MARTVFVVTVWTVFLGIYALAVLSIGLPVAAAAIFAAGVLTSSTFISYAAGVLSFVLVVVFAVLFFIGMVKYFDV